MSDRLSRPEWAARVRRLTDYLKTLQPGDLITIEQISRIVGYDIDKRRAIYYSAATQAAVEAGMDFVNIPRQGYRCIRRTGGPYQSSLPLQVAANEIHAEPPPETNTDTPDPDADWQELKIRLGTTAIMVIEQWMRRP